MTITLEDKNVYDSNDTKLILWLSNDKNSVFIDSLIGGWQFTLEDFFNAVQSILHLLDREQRITAVKQMLISYDSILIEIHHDTVDELADIEWSTHKSVNGFSYIKVIATLYGVSSEQIIIREDAPITNHELKHLYAMAIIDLTSKLNDHFVQILELLS